MTGGSTLSALPAVLTINAVGGVLPSNEETY
ncbi:hypothetical protein J2S56_000750 [Corynebacterium lowii]|nr:hypothetical protein [Corynebacterium lowii]